jgi:hypothetical protein
MCAFAAGFRVGAMNSARNTYRIVVRGRLSERLGSAFAGMSLEPQDGATALVGVVSDQSHLFGLLERVQALGLELLRVEPVCE